MEPAFLSLEDVLEIHRDQIMRYGGTHGVRDVGLLQSAVCMPMAQFDGKFLHADVYEMAGAYMFHLVMNHPFVDGNKRVGVVAALMFLALNGFEVTVANDRFEKQVMDMIAGTADKEKVGRFFKRYAHRNREI